MKEDFKCWFSKITDAQVDAYFESEEAKREVNRVYAEKIAKLKKGEITEKIFRNGCVTSIAMCLSLMYDGPLS